VGRERCEQFRKEKQIHGEGGREVINLVSMVEEKQNYNWAENEDGSQRTGGR